MEKIGLFASGDRFSHIAFQEIKKRGFLPVVFSFEKPSFPDNKNEIILTFGDIEAFIKHARSLNITRVVFAGKMYMSDIFKKKIAISGSNFLARIKRFNSENILNNLVGFLEQNHIKTIPLTTIFNEYLVQEKLYTSTIPTTFQWKDIYTGWGIAKQVAKMNIGQSVAVKNGIVAAVEAIEGTNDMIKRAGGLCSDFVVIKVIKNNQDVRFDLPTIGPITIRTISRAKGKIIAVEAGKTVMVDAKNTVALAEKLNIGIVGFKGKEIR
ncbi:MAG TPA: UDP-2,3-diacylglucosamine diphosphatase LpxI [bacterium]|nr:UDP-2,3-diacylglucosamine diphosphatase LpxI [bacterium]